MKKKILNLRKWYLGMIGVGWLGLGCTARPTESRDPGNDSDFKQFQSKNLMGADFGLGPGEIVLTLDDGVGRRTKQLAQFLRTQNVPTVFFTHAQNDKNDINGAGIKNPSFGRSTAVEICKDGFHSLSSHRDDHNTFGNNAPSDLDETDKLITQICPNQKYLYYRAPGGNFNLRTQPGPLNHLRNLRDRPGW
jgi:peptidoglycan/xylan/chitin deacetylase (PgdA/CDA1 family)